MTQQTEYELTQTLSLFRECIQSMATSMESISKSLETIAASASTSGSVSTGAINEVKQMAASMYPGITDANIMTVLRNMGLADASVDTVRAKMVDILQALSTVMSNPFDVRAAKLVE